MTAVTLLPNKVLQDYTVEDVCDLLSKLKLGEHTKAFQDKKVNGRVLGGLTIEKLKSEFGFTNEGHARLLSMKVEQLKNESGK